MQRLSVYRGQLRYQWGRVSSNEVANVVTLAWWVWCLLVPGHHVFSMAPKSYAAMREVAPQLVWGVVMLAILLKLSVALSLHHWRVHIAMLVICSSLWALVAFMILVSNPYAPGVGVYAALAGLTLRRAVRLAGHG